MELQHVNVKIYVEGDLQVDPEQLIELFHEWVSQQVADELLIDVADYWHVPAGPGVVVVGHEADYAMDNGGDQYGMLYNRKAPLDGDNQSRLRQALGAAAAACRRLEEAFHGDGALRFSRDEFAIIINDRGLAPNSEETLDACRPDLEAFLKSSLGHSEFTVERQSDDPRFRFGVVVRSGQPFDLEALVGG